MMFGSSWSGASDGQPGPVRIGVVVPDVDRGAGDAAVAQRVIQRPLVDDGPAPDVDEVRRRCAGRPGRAHRRDRWCRLRAAPRRRGTVRRERTSARSPRPPRRSRPDACRRSSDGCSVTAETRIPTKAAQRATSRPMCPSPTISRLRPRSSRSGPPRQRPSRRSWSAREELAVQRSHRHEHVLGDAVVVAVDVAHDDARRHGIRARSRRSRRRRRGSAGGVAHARATRGGRRR